MTLNISSSPYASRWQNSGILFLTFGLFGPLLVEVASAIVYGGFKALTYHLKSALFDIFGLLRAARPTGPS